MPACSWRRSSRGLLRRRRNSNAPSRQLRITARFVGCNVMHLQDGTRAHFLSFIGKEFPSMVPRFEKLYARKYPPEAYRKEVKAMVSVLQERYGKTKREDADNRAPTPESTESSPEQVGFKW